MTIQSLCLFSNGTACSDYTILLCSSTKIAVTLCVCQIATGRHLCLHKYQAASKHIPPPCIFGLNMSLPVRSVMFCIGHFDTVMFCPGQFHTELICWYRAEIWRLFIRPRISMFAVMEEVKSIQPKLSIQSLNPVLHLQCRSTLPINSHANH